MAVTAMCQRFFVCLIVLLSLTDQDCEAACTPQELMQLMNCLVPYNTKFIQTFGTTGPCNRTLITSDLCTDFDGIVVCANGKTVSNDSCRHSGVEQVNEQLVIPCKIQDFVTACPNATAINEGTSGGCRVEGVTLPLLLASLTAVFINMRQNH